MRRTNRSGPAGPKKKTGFTILDLLVGIMIAVITVGAVSTSLTSSFALNRSNAERAIAIEVAEGVVERIRSEDFEEIYLRYNGTVADDPATGVSPGSLFDVSGLRVKSDDPDGAVGGIEFPGNGTVLREDSGDRNLGMPRDLNLDGDIDALDHKTDYLVLPLRVVVSWQGAGSPQQIELTTSITRR